MGNKKSNSYWEAEMPPDFNRSDTENFIRMKYERKKWIPKKATQSAPTIEEKNSSYNTGREHKNSSGCYNNSQKSSSHIETPVKGEKLIDMIPCQGKASPLSAATPHGRPTLSCAERDTELDANCSSGDYGIEIQKDNSWFPGRKKSMSSCNGFKWKSGRKVNPSNAISTTPQGIFESAVKKE